MVTELLLQKYRKEISQNVDRFECRRAVRLTYDML